MTVMLSEKRQREILQCFEDANWMVFREIGPPEWSHIQAPTMHELQAMKRLGLVGYRPGWVSDSRLGTWALTEAGLAKLEARD